MATGSERLWKRKAVAKLGYSRVLSCLQKSVAKEVPFAVLQFIMGDLEKKYVKFEESCKECLKQVEDKRLDEVSKELAVCSEIVCGLKRCVEIGPEFFRDNALQVIRVIDSFKQPCSTQSNEQCIEGESSVPKTDRLEESKVEEESVDSMQHIQGDVRANDYDNAIHSVLGEDSKASEEDNVHSSVKVGQGDDSDLNDIHADVEVKELCSSDNDDVNIHSVQVKPDDVYAKENESIHSIRNQEQEQGQIQGQVQSEVEAVSQNVVLGQVQEFKSPSSQKPGKESDYGIFRASSRLSTATFQSYGVYNSIVASFRYPSLKFFQSDDECVAVSPSVTSHSLDEERLFSPVRDSDHMLYKLIGFPARDSSFSVFSSDNGAISDGFVVPSKSVLSALPVNGQGVT
jgi:hypothetical protein